MFREFFYFSKSDRMVIVFLLAVSTVALLLIYGLGSSVPAGEKFYSGGDTVDSGNGVRNVREHRSYVYYAGTEAHRELFAFDPNTADSTQLLKLGLQPWQVRSIYKYRAKGGIYRKPSDFARLYGLTVKQYRELEPYIRIGDDYRPASEIIAVESGVYERDTVIYPQKLKSGEYIMLNHADTSQLKKVPGIGRYYAREIVSYRNRLGGYSSVNQLSEIDGFPHEALEYFVVHSDEIFKKINVNRCSLNEMKRHPYLSFFQARAIMDYRRLKGHIESLDNLSLLKEFSSEDIARLTPYVEF